MFTWLVIILIIVKFLGLFTNILRNYFIKKNIILKGILLFFKIINYFIYFAIIIDLFEKMIKCVLEEDTNLYITRFLK